MEVLTRQVCPQCDGVGSYRKLIGQSLGKYEMPPANYVPTRMVTVTCGHCQDGYVEEWVELNELLSRGIN